MSVLPSPRSGPVLQLIASGLKLWIRSSCESIGDLQLELQGSGLRLLQGKLDGVTLTARDVRFRGLPLQLADLRSGPIQVTLTPGGVVLQQFFDVQGEVTITGRALNEALLSEPWRWLGDWLAEQLMGLTPLGGLLIDNDQMELKAPVAAHKDPARRRFRLRAAQGTVAIQPIDDDRTTLLPMDEGIKIEQAQLQAGILHLQGRARVTP